MTAVDRVLLEWIPQAAKSVVEIGCGEGLLGAIYKRINPASLYIGVEDDQALAGSAEAKLDTLQIGAFDHLDFPGNPDCIIYNHVFERMLDPDTVLTRHARQISDDGVIVAAISNAQSGDELTAFLRGAWPRRLPEIPPKKQLQHFTRTRIIDMFRRAGLHIHDIRADRRTTSDPVAMSKDLAPLLTGLGIDANKMTHLLAPQRYLIRAGRRPLKRTLLHNVTLVPGPGQSQIIEIRVRQPMSAIGSYPAIEMVQEPFRGLTIQERPAAVEKICILQRIILTKDWGFKLVQRLLKANYLVVAEWDDDPDHWPAIAENDSFALCGVHALQTSTPVLAQKLRRFNPETAIFPNAISELPPLRPPQSADKVTLFFGALNREADWAPYIDALNTVLRSRPKLQVVVLHDSRFFAALQTDRKIFRPTCLTEDYYRWLGGADICFMPLSDTPFNRMKSDLKFIEAAAYGAVALASPIIYGDVIRDGDNGMLFETADMLAEKLGRLVDNQGLRLRLAGAARDYVVRERMLGPAIPKRIDWYKSLLQRRDELNKALKERCPELFAD